MKRLLEHFQVEPRGSSLQRELLGGVVTFFAMAYIVVVNPAILSAAGVPLEAAVVATCLASALACVLMGAWANLPIALAPGMGLNAFFAFSLCLGAGIAWQTALGIVFWAGIVFLVLTISGARRAIVEAIPPLLKNAGAAGIGAFIAFIGLRQGGLVRNDDATLVALGDLTSRSAEITLAALAVAVVLSVRGSRIGTFLGLAVALFLAIASGEVVLPALSEMARPPELVVPGASIDLLGALRVDYLPYLLVIVFFDLFDTMGTLFGVTKQAGLQVDGRIPEVDRALAVDAVGTTAGALIGTSPVTCYIESAAGTTTGAKTGLASIVTGLCFLAALPLTPIVTAVGAGNDGLNPVTAPALILVGLLMTRPLREIDWHELRDAVPAFLTVLLMPLTYNISHGLAAGVVVFTLVSAVSGRRHELHWLMWLLSGLLVLRYALLPL